VVLEKLRERPLKGKMGDAISEDAGAQPDKK